MSKLTRVVVMAAGLLGPIIVMDAMDAAYVERLPFPHPNEIVLIRGVAQPGRSDFSDLFAECPSVSGVTVLTYGRATLSRATESRRIDILTADHLTFSVLGIAPVLGRTFSRADLRESQVALVSLAVWRTIFSASESLSGHMIVNGRSYAVIGVAPDALSRLGAFDVVLPRREGRFDGPWLGENQTFLRQETIGRRASNASLETVRSDMERIQRLRDRGENHSTVTVVRLSDAFSKPVEPILKALVVAGATLFLLAAVTTGLLAGMQSTDRVPEYAIRGALGATVLQLRTEAMRPWFRSMIPAGAISLGAAIPLSRLTRIALPSLGSGSAAMTTLILITALVGLALSLVVILCTQIPMRRMAWSNAATLLRTSSIVRLRSASTLVAVQLALSGGLICAAIVAMSAFQAQIGRDFGVTADEVQAFNVDLGEGRPSPEVNQAWDRLSAEMRSFGGTFGSGLPWTRTPESWVKSLTTGRGVFVGVTSVSRDFFSMLGIKFVQGQDPFGSPDPRSIVLSQSLGDRLALGVGDLVSLDDEELRVAGLVTEVANIGQGPDGSTLRAYLSIAASPPPASATIMFRGSPQEAIRLRSSSEAALPWASFQNPSKLTDQFQQHLERERLGVVVLAGYAFLASVLASLGLHALIGRVVAQRRPEIAVRLALGASPSQVTSRLVQTLLVPVSLGLVAATFVGIQLSKIVGLLMPWASPLSPSHYIIGVATSLSIAVLAVIPAFRTASRLEPANILREVG